MLVGRERELAILERLLGDAREGRSGALLVVGEPGIGKSALLDEAVRMARGFRTLETRPVESEAMLPFAGLHALLRPVLDAIDRIPPAQARTLATALRLREGEAPDRFTVGAGTLSLLAEVAEDAPLLVVVDDAHWLDQASADALAFATRRFAAEEVAVLVASRGDEAGGFRPAGVETLELGPLDGDAAERLLHESAAGLDPARAGELLAVAAGNPLALVELPLRPGPALDSPGFSEPRELTERLAEAFLASAGRLPEPARRGLLVAAAGEGLDAATLARAAETFGAGENPFAAAEEAGLARVVRGSLVFRHPLVRSAVYHAASPADRRAAHRAVAAALDRRADADRRAWQLAAGADGPDAAIADALEAAADRAEARGGAAARSRALEWAADLSEDDDTRGRRLHAAARAAHWAGEPERAVALIERVLPTVTDPLVRADLVQERVSVLDWRGQRTPAGVLEAEAARVEELDPERAARLRFLALNRAIEALDAPGALRAAAAIEPLLDRLGAFWRPRISGGVGQAYLQAGDADRASGLYRSLLGDADAASTQAFGLVWLEWYDEARRVLELSCENGRRSGQTLRVAWTRVCLAQLDLVLGRLPAALAAAQEARSLAEGMEVEYIELLALVVLARVAAVQGKADDTHSLAARAGAIAETHADRHGQCSVRLALGLLELGAGRNAEAIEQLAPVAALAAANGLADPSVLPYAPDLIEAYVRSGQTAEARAELDRLAGQAETTRRSWALAAAARCEGLLAADVDVDARFAEALARHGRVPSPFERGRTELCYGERLRRAGRRVDARVHLRAALAAFEELGAAPWAERARVELKASGETVRKRDPTAAEQLTPQELQIALLVAEGRANKEVAAALFLSPKTVEYHLTRVYRKLNVYSRTELTRLLAGGSG
jgi:DNA-binding CsgD family transcriptional regulator